MKRRAPLTAPLTALTLLLACAAGVSAQEPEQRAGYAPIPSWELTRSAKGGKRYAVSYVKFLKVFETQFKVYAGRKGSRTIRSRLEGVLRVREGSTLQQELLARRDSEKNQLQPKVSNVQVFGTWTVKGEDRYLLLDRVVALGSQLERFEAAAKKLGEEDGDGRRALVRVIDYAVRYHPEDQAAVQPLRERLLAEARAIAVAKLPALPAGAAERIAVGLKQRDLSVVAEVWEHPQVSAAERKSAEETLRKLGATLYHGEWIPLSDLKDELGFLRRKRSYVRQEVVWLEEGIAREKARLAASQPRRDYSERDMATFRRAGKIVRGMEKDWVVAALKAADKPGLYPRHVERLREVRDDKQELLWELWVMPNGDQIYFFNGWVTERIESEEAEDESSEDESGDGGKEPEKEPERGDGEKTKTGAGEGEKTE